MKTAAMLSCLWLLPLTLLKSQSVSDLRKTSCADCHNQEFSGFKTDLHFTEGKIVCMDCHGGDPVSGDEDTSMYLSPDWVGRPAPDQVAGFCGRCHESVVNAYSLSRNAESSGMRNLTVPRPRPASRELSLDPDHPSPSTWKACISCHGVHGMDKPKPDLIAETADRFPQAILEPDISTVLAHCAHLSDSLRQAVLGIRAAGIPIDPAVWRNLDSLQGALHELRVVQHTMKTGRITAVTARFSAYWESAEEQILAAVEAQNDRKFGLLFMWGFIFAASAFLYARQKQTGTKKSNGETRS